MLNLIVDEVLNTEATFQSGGSTYQLLSEINDDAALYRYKALVTSPDGTTEIKPVYPMDIPKGFQVKICKFLNSAWFKRGDVVLVRRKTKDEIIKFSGIVVATSPDGFGVTYYDSNNELVKQLFLPAVVLKSNIEIIKYDEPDA